ncbi:membrane protein [Bryobacterales bacterium F-183]|nr:membrane protein [Bryobacterales bacterium F-183]
MGLPNNTVSTRLQSLDVYRGATMLFMASEIMRIPRVAHQWGAESGFWRFIEFQTSHVAWSGWSVWDMIQPSFMFMAGVALPWSIASRLGRGDRPMQLWLHALWRSFLLVALGIFLRSTGKQQTYFTFEDVLTQIGLGYPFLFALGFASMRVQAMAAGAVLLGYWAWFAVFPAPGADYPWTAVGVPADWPHHLQGFASHWDKNSNPAHFFDVWFLNLFPREKPFLFNGGGYLTLNFVPSLATMIFGLLAGGVLRSGVPDRVRRLVMYGMAGLVLGWGLDTLGIAPMVKRIWTPGWAIFAGGFTTLVLAGVYWMVDVQGWRKWTFPFHVVGMNSIAMYVLVHLIDGFLAESLKIHLGRAVFEFFGTALAPVVQGAAVLTLLWMMLLWMYRRKIFLRI